MKGKFLIALLSLTFLVVFTGLSFAQFGSISGRVTDEVSGDPIAGAVITLSGIWGFWHTNSQGYYGCDSIPAGAYIVTAYASGYFPETYPESVTVIEGENTSDIDFALTPTGEGTGSISGTVTDEVTGEPILGAHVIAVGLDNWCFGHAWTDSAGYYIIENLCAGLWSVRAEALGYVPEVYPDSVPVVEGQNTPGIDFALAPHGGPEFGSISGRITDEETGIGLPMAHVWAHGQGGGPGGGDTWSDTAGYYLIQDLAAGQYAVGVHKDGYEDEVYPELVIVEEGQNTPDIDFALTFLGGPEFGSISGRITDEETGIGLPMAHVWAHGQGGTPGGGETWSDTAGYYLIQGLAAGQYTVGVHKDGYEDEVYPELVIVEEGQNTPDIDFALTFLGGPEFGSIAGRVTDEETGLPIIMAEITITGIYCVWYTDTSGLYFCNNLPPDSYEVNARKYGYIPETYPDLVTVTAGEITSGIDFALTPMGDPGSISGTVTDANTGEPIPDAHVWACGEFGHGCAQTNSTGEYTISGLYAGEYFVSTWAWGYYPEDYPTTVTVAEGQDTPGIDFALIPYGGPGGGVIAGIVLEDSTLLPIPDAIVFAVSFNGNWGFDFADSGMYVIEGLQTDDYYVFAIAPGYIGEFYDGVYSWREATLVTPDAYDVNFYLGICGSYDYDGRVSGVISSEGLPIDGAFVYAEADGETKGFARSSSEGGYVMNGLNPGTYTVYASKVSYHDGSYPDPVPVGHGRVSGIDIELPPVQIGDANGNGSIEAGDVVFLISYLFRGGSAPDPLMTGDLNGDGVINSGDIVYLISYLFRDGPTPGNP